MKAYSSNGIEPSKLCECYVLVLPQVQREQLICGNPEVDFKDLPLSAQTLRIFAAETQRIQKKSIELASNEVLPNHYSFCSLRCRYGLCASPGS